MEGCCGIAEAAGYGAGRQVDGERGYGAPGLVELPLHVAWSGRRVYDVGDDDQRLVFYALLLAEAQREDLERFVHRESLVSMWPRLRRLLGPHARREWERQLITPACR